MNRKHIFLLLIALALLLSGCGCDHQWRDASCAAPRTCAECGETEGIALEHMWMPATCEAPKTCQVCGLENGEAAGHTWADNSTETLGYCTTCGKAVEFFLHNGAVAAWTEYVQVYELYYSTGERLPEPYDTYEVNFG